MAEDPAEDEANNLILEERIEDDIDKIAVIDPIMSRPNLGLIWLQTCLTHDCQVNSNKWDART